MKTKQKKCMIILLVILILIATCIGVGIFIYNKMNWNGYKTYKTDLFSIKYKDSWKVEKIPSDSAFAVTFSDSNDTLSIVIMDKENAPDDQNTLEKLKNNWLQQLEDFKIEEYQTKKPTTQRINKSNMKGLKITSSYYILFQPFEIVFDVIEKDNYFYTLVFQGENTEIFDKIFESFKIK